MLTEAIIKKWFELWELGHFYDLPVTDDFTHVSPFGCIKGKKAYMDLVNKNKDKFLGYHFKIRDTIYELDRACVRYTGIQGDFSLDVSEWYYFKGDLIQEIIAYYHIGEIREGRQLKQ